MRKTILYGIAAFVGLGAGSAMADVDVFATIDKTKIVNVTETINITKNVDIDARVIVTPDKAAESEALINQENFNNQGCENCAEKHDTIQNTGNENSGVLSVNQAAGNMNNQGNAVSAAVDLSIVIPPPTNGDTPEGSVGFAESQAAVEQANGVPAGQPGDQLSIDQMGPGNHVESVNLLFRDAHVLGSFNDNDGVVHFNQSAGNMANQANALSLAVSFATAGVALSEADLGQVNTGNTVLESDTEADPIVGVTKTANAVGSMNGNTGIVGGNQTSGHLANQANVVSFSAAQLAAVAPVQ